jgi:hypothetical protein
VKKVLTLSLLLLLFSATNTVLAVDTLHPGEWLVKGQDLSSNNGYYRFIMQSDGNLVLCVGGNRPLWSSGTYGKAVIGVVMQDDGNLVIYSPQWEALWNSGTWGKPGSYLVVQNDGNVVIYRPTCPIWATNTNY